jgi:cobyrinic acid a,c-diamide synthase
MELLTPRLVIAGLAGDSGKTLVTLGLARAFVERGLRVAPYKKGPDYIDAAWLEAATGEAGRNLDTFLMDARALGEGLARGAAADLLLVEGNRGLFDGLDSEGRHSTAELAKRMGAPVILVLDVTKMTRTAAALVAGCKALDPQVPLAGIVLNRVGTARHEKIVREAIAGAGGPPVLGAIPRLKGSWLPGRHLGLVTAAEHPRREEALQAVAAAVSRHVDLQAVLDLSRSATPARFPASSPPPTGSVARIGVLRDEALSFYYPENLEALQACGAELVTVSPLREPGLPELDGLYFGGGFPEVHVSRLAANGSLREAVRDAAGAGMPIYAECGGLMYLARELIVDGVSHPMAGVLDLVVEQTARPVGHGYVEAEVERPNPFFPPTTKLRGHEFHYSRILSGDHAAASCLRLRRGEGTGGGRDGIAVGSVWASYLHVHALGTPSWAVTFASLARSWRADRNRGTVRRHPGSASGPARGNLETDDDTTGPENHEFAPARA